MMETVDGWLEGFEAGFEAASSALSRGELLDTFEGIKELCAGALIRDAKRRVLFRTSASGWVSVSGTHFSSMYIPLPVELLYSGAVRS